MAIYNDGFRPITLLEVVVQSDTLRLSALYEINETIPVNGVVSRDDIGGERKIQMATIDDILIPLAAHDVSMETVIPVAAIPEDRDYTFQRDRSDGDPVLFDCQGTLHYIPYGEEEVREYPFDCVYFAAFTPNIEAWFANRKKYSNKLISQEAKK